MSSALEVPRARLVRFAWFNVVFNLFVILWGAFVRATGSGAGCGDHWPTCNGEVIPRAPAVETMIELTHRVTSGGALILSVVLAVWVWRLWPKGSAVRMASGATVFFMFVEAGVGAMLVLLKMTGENDSMARALVMGVHLVNTLLLMGAMVLAAWLAGGRPMPRVSTDRMAAALLGVAVLGMLALGATGGITALGDTLFPAESLAQGIRDDLSPTAHLLVRLRVFHPLLAVLVAAYTAVVALNIGLSKGPLARRFTYALVGLMGLQVVVGSVNVVLLAPVWIQLIHLLMADLVWISLVCLVAEVLAPAPPGRLGASVG